MLRPRVTKKENGLIKGALRRVFARSELRQKVLNTADIVYIDASRPRVRKWSQCPSCNKPTPKYLMVVDHVDPVIPIETSFEAMSLDVVVNRLWCEEKGLQPLCEICHSVKTKAENKARKRSKKK